MFKIFFVDGFHIIPGYLGSSEILQNMCFRSLLTRNHIPSSLKMFRSGTKINNLYGVSPADGRIWWKGRKRKSSWEMSKKFLFTRPVPETISRPPEGVGWWSKYLRSENNQRYWKKNRENQPGVHLKTRGKWEHIPARVFRNYWISQISWFGLFSM